MKKAVLTMFLSVLTIACAFGANYSTSTWLLAGSYPEYAAIAGASEAASFGVSAASGNPAAIGSVENIEFSVMAGRWLSDTGMQRLSVAKSFEAGSLAVDLLYFDLGSAAKITADEFENPVMTSEVMNMSAWGASLIYAKKIRNFSLGVSLKGFMENMDGSGAFVWCADAGFIYDGFFSEDLKLGVSMLNISGGSGDYFTPINLKAAASYTLKDKSSPVAGFSAAAGYLIKESHLEGRAGVEIFALNTLCLRAGACFSNSGSLAFSAGAGLKYEDMAVNYSYEPDAVLGDSHRVSLSASFGKTEAAAKDADTVQEKGTFDSYLESADYYYENKQYRQALKYYEYINLLYWKELEDKNDKFKSAFYQKMGISYYNLKENKRAAQYFDRALYYDRENEILKHWIKLLK